MRAIAIILTIASAAFCSIGSLYLKKGTKKAKKASDYLFNKKIMLGMSIYLAATVLYLVALRMEELSVLFSISATQYIFTAVLAKNFEKERITAKRWAGIMLIIAGIALISIS